MISVWYDSDCDQLWITGEERSYARRSLVAFVDPNTNKVGIRLKEGYAPNIVMTPFDNLVDHLGNTFSSSSDALNYLNAQFLKRREISATFAQSQPSSTWNIPHQLGFNPSVILVDSSGDAFEGDVNYPDTNTVLVTLSAPVAGSAYLS